MCVAAQVCNLSVSIPSYGSEDGQGLFVFVFIVECVFCSHVCVFHTRQSFFVVFRPALVSITADGVDKLNDRVGCSNRPDPATETAHRPLFSALVLSPLYPMRFYFCPRLSWPLCLLPFFFLNVVFFLNSGLKVTVGKKLEQRLHLALIST